MSTQALRSVIIVLIIGFPCLTQAGDDSAGQPICTTACCGRPAASDRYAVSETESGKVRAIIEAQNARYMAAFKEKDAAAIAALHSEDVTVMAPGRQVVRGRKATEQLLFEDFQAGADEICFKTLEVSVNSDTAYEVGLYTVTVRSESKETIADGGHYVVIWKRQPDGNWLMHADIWNNGLSLPRQ